jgi:hypothetical protein
MYCSSARPQVHRLPQRQQPLHARSHITVATAHKQGAKLEVIDPCSDVWTADFITPQQRKAQLRTPTGPLIPDFLVELTGYDPQEYVEIGFVWKAIGARGEVLMRVCTSLQDYRVGLPGPRCENTVLLIGTVCFPVLNFTLYVVCELAFPYGVGGCAEARHK